MLEIYYNTLKKVIYQFQGNCPYFIKEFDNKLEIIKDKRTTFYIEEKGSKEIDYLLQIIKRIYIPRNFPVEIVRNIFVFIPDNISIERKIITFEKLQKNNTKLTLYESIIEKLKKNKQNKLLHVLKKRIENLKEINQNFNNSSYNVNENTKIEEIIRMIRILQ